MAVEGCLPAQHDLVCGRIGISPPGHDLHPERFQGGHLVVDCDELCRSTL
jgi:hypothetical protein